MHRYAYQCSLVDTLNSVEQDDTPFFMVMRIWYTWQRVGVAKCRLAKKRFPLTSRWRIIQYRVSHYDSNFSTTAAFSTPMFTPPVIPTDAYSVSAAFTKHCLPGTPVNRPGNAHCLSKLFIARLPGVISFEGNVKILLPIVAIYVAALN